MSDHAGTTLPLLWHQDFYSQLMSISTYSCVCSSGRQLRLLVRQATPGHNRFSTHSPVLLGVDDRAELASDELCSKSHILEGVVIVEPEQSTQGALECKT